MKRRKKSKFAWPLAILYASAAVIVSFSLYYCIAPSFEEAQSSLANLASGATIEVIEHTTATEESTQVDHEVEENNSMVIHKETHIIEPTSTPQEEAAEKVIPDPTATPEVVATPQATVTTVPTVQTTVAPTPTVTPEIKVISEPSAEPIEVTTPKPTAALTPQPTLAPVSTPTLTPTSSPTPAPTPIPTLISSPEPTIDPEPTVDPEEEYMKKVGQEIIDRGSMGRLKISSVGVDVALFYCGSLSGAQGIVDNQDSAAVIDWKCGNRLIADHSNQGFDGIRDCKVGTRCKIYTDFKVKSYKCIEVIPNGYNIGTDLTYNDQTPIGNNYSNTMIMYTCNGDGTITIVIWDCR